MTAHSPCQPLVIACRSGLSLGVPFNTRNRSFYPLTIALAENARRDAI